MGDPEHQHHGFPVAEPTTGTFLGLIRRKELLHILDVGQEQNFAPNRLGAQGLDDTLQHPGQYSRSPAEIIAGVNPDDFDKQVNLMPYTNAAVYSILDHASVLRCFALFRSMG